MLMHLSNLSRLWLIAELHEQDLPWVEVGSPVRIELPYGPGRAVTGRVDFIYDMLDPETRTVRARIVVPNPDGKLKPGMYATAFIQGGAAEPAPVVPSEAVLWTGEQEVVLLALGNGRFRPVEVETGLRADGKVQILAGLEGGGRIVTSAQFLIGSEAQLQGALAAMTSGAGGEDMGGMEAMGSVNGMSSMEQSHGAAAAVTPADVRAADANGDANGDGFVYQGPMHPQEIQDTPGTCEVCGMELRRVPVEEAIENLMNDK